MILDITKEKTRFLTRKVNHLVSKMDNLPDKLIITVKQFEYLHRHIEVFAGDERNETEFIFHGRYNLMEVKII